MDMIGTQRSEIEADCGTVPKKRHSNDSVVQEHLAKLRGAGASRGAFDAAFAALNADNRVQVTEAIEIAAHYTGTSKRVASRAAAMSAISKKIVEIERYHAKNAMAAKARPL